MSSSQVQWLWRDTGSHNYSPGPNTGCHAYSLVSDTGCHDYLPGPNTGCHSYSPGSDPSCHDYSLGSDTGCHGYSPWHFAGCHDYSRGCDTGYHGYSPGPDSGCHGYSPGPDSGCHGYSPGSEAIPEPSCESGFGGRGDWPSFRVEGHGVRGHAGGGGALGQLKDVQQTPPPQQLGPVTPVCSHGDDDDVTTLRWRHHTRDDDVTHSFRLWNRE